MHRRIVSPATTKLRLWEAPLSKLWTGETETGNLNLTLYFKISQNTRVFKIGDSPGWNTGLMVLWRVGGRSLQQASCEQKRSDVKQQSIFVSWKTIHA